MAGDGETAGLVLESLARRLELLGRETQREKGRPPPGTLPRGAASRVASCLALSCPAPRDAARALRSLPLASGAHWVELVKGAARRGSAAGVRAALSAALSDPRIARAEDFESDWQREARDAGAGDEEEEQEQGGGGARRRRRKKSSRRSPLDDASTASAAVRVAAVVAFGELGRAAAAEQAYNDAIAAGAWDEAGRRRQRRRGGGSGGSGSGNESSSSGGDGDGNGSSNSEGIISPLNALLNALLVARARPRAAAAAARAKEAGAVFDLVTFNTLLKGCMRSADAAGAEVLLKDLSAAGLKGDEYTWNTAVKCFAYAGDLGRALRVLEDIGKSDEDNEAERLGEKKHVPRAVWGSLLVACGRAGAPAAAARLWSEMLSAGVDPGLDGCHARLHACAYALDWEGAWGLLNEMRGRGSSLSSSSTSSSSSPSSSSLSSSSSSSTSSTSSSAPPLPCKLRRRPLPRPTALSYNLVLRAARPPPGRNPAGRRGSRDAQPLARGEAVLAAMREDQVEPDSVTFTSLIELATSVGDGLRAAQLFEEMENVAGIRADAKACGALYAACGCDRSRPELADVALSVFRRTVWGPRRSRPGPVQFRALILALLDQGRAEDAAAVAAGAAAACKKSAAAAAEAGGGEKGGGKLTEAQGGAGGISNVLSPKEVARLTAAVVEAAAAANGGGGSSSGGGISSALSKLLLPALGVSPEASAEQVSSSSSSEDEEVSPSSSSSTSSPSVSAASPGGEDQAVLDVSSLRLSPTEARAAVLCALADLAAAGRAPRGGLKVVVSRGQQNKPSSSSSSSSSSLLRPTIVRLLRDELRLLEKDGGGGEGGGGDGREKKREASSASLPSSSLPSSLDGEEVGEEREQLDDSSPVCVSERALTKWLERRGGGSKRAE